MNLSASVGLKCIFNVWLGVYVAIVLALTYIKIPVSCSRGDMDPWGNQITGAMVPGYHITGGTKSPWRKCLTW